MWQTVTNLSLNTQCHNFMVSTFWKLICLFKHKLLPSYGDRRFIFLLKMDSVTLEFLLVFTLWSQIPTLLQTEQLSHICFRIWGMFLINSRHKFKTKVIILQFVPNITTLWRDKTGLALPAKLQSIRKLKAYDIIQEPNQLTNVTRLPTEPFMFMGHIWDRNHSIQSTIVMREMQENYYLVLFMFARQLYFYVLGPISLLGY